MGPVALSGARDVDLLIICLVTTITLLFTSTGYEPWLSSVDICSTSSIAYFSYLRPLSCYTNWSLISPHLDLVTAHQPQHQLHIFGPSPGFHSLISWQILPAVAQQPPKDCSQPVVEQDPSSLSSVTKPHPWPSSWLVCQLTEASC